MMTQGLGARVVCSATHEPHESWVGAFPIELGTCAWPRVGLTFSQQKQGIAIGESTLTYALAFHDIDHASCCSRDCTACNPFAIGSD